MDGGAPTGPGRSSGMRTFAGIFAAALAVFAASQIGMLFSSPGEFHFSPFWPSSAVALAAVALGGWWMLVGVYIGVAASNMLWDLEAVFAWIGPMGNVLEAGAAWWLVTLLAGPRARLTDLRSCFAFLIAPWLPAALSGLHCAALLNFETVADEHTFGREWALFVLANAGAAVLLVPSAVVWTERPNNGWWRQFAILAAVTTGFFAAVFWPSSVLSPYLLLLPLVAVAVMLGLRGAAPMIGGVTLAACTVTRLDAGPFVAGGTLDSFAPLYFCLLLITATVLPVGAVTDRFRQRLARAHRAVGGTGLVVWWWSRSDGLRTDPLDEACPAAGSLPPGMDPQDMFNTETDCGLREIDLGGRPMLSVWQITGRGDDNQPVAASGLLFEAAGQLMVGEAQRRAWESEIELRNLRASLTPHLLFNCLAAVRGIVRTDPECARVFIDRLARFLRDTTNAQTRDTLPLIDEWQLCEDFLALQSMRYERELPRLVEIENAAYHARIPPMILLNLVENAVKHGEVSQKHPLVISARIDGDSLEARVRNHGKLGPLPTSRPGGLGMARARLAAVYGQTGSLDILPEGDDVVAVVRIPPRPPASP